MHSSTSLDSKVATAPSQATDVLNSCASSSVPIWFAVDPKAGMLKVPGGTFEPGSNAGYADEKPSGSVTVETFWMDRTEVTNAQFARFVEANAYITDAEREGAAAVFKQPPSDQPVRREGEWWHFVDGANWRHPEGHGSDLVGRDSEPVVHVTLNDAQAYANWLQRDLPTEAEWEFAALGAGQAEKIERVPVDKEGNPTANFWQGVFPQINTNKDGYISRSPVGCYPANGLGLRDMIGNVWEWTKDNYSGARQVHGNGDPSLSISSSNHTLNLGKVKVIKGGSFLCAPDYCARYRSSARHPQEANMAVAHVGFRTVLRVR